MTDPIAVKCLLVDDLDENLLAMGALLRRDDVEILTARSGAEALELLLAHDVALAILDVQMPEMDGFELAELMRGAARTRDVPIIFVTAGSRDLQRVFRGYDAGAVDFLFKPVEPHILLNKVEVFLQLYRQKIELAQELRERTERLRLNELFLAVLGHDLRSPLSAIVNWGRILERSPDPQRLPDIGKRLQASGHRMQQLIEDLLDVARTRFGGGMSLRVAPCDLGQVAQRIVDERTLGEKPERVRYRRSGDLVGEWDADRLGQVISNLLGNALQHGIPEQPIEIDLEGNSAEAVFIRIANGGTIPAQVLPTLFDPFRAGREHSGREGGLGLGLYIVDQIVKAHGGAIMVTSAERTLFETRLPRVASGGSNAGTSEDRKLRGS
jgi:two-component system, sensor histidine kinase and response regulator